MTAYIVRRLLWAILVLFALAIITFYLTYVLPADPARLVAGVKASPEDVERIRHALGLDQPFFAQLITYLGRLAHLDFGHSYHQDRDVLPLILERFPATLQLALAGLALELVIGVPLGLMAATRRGTWFDRAATATTIVLVSAPSFWVGYLILEAVFQLNWRVHASASPVTDAGPSRSRSRFSARCRRTRAAVSLTPSTWATSLNGSSSK